MAHFINAKGSRISNTIQQAGVRARVTIGVWGAAGLSVGPNDMSIATIKKMGPDNANNTWFELTAQRTGYVMVEAKQGASVWDYFQLAVLEGAAVNPVAPSAPAVALKPAEIVPNLQGGSPNPKAVLGVLNGMSMSDMLSSLSQVKANGLLSRLTANFDQNAAAYGKTRLNVAIKAVEMRGSIHPLDFEKQYSASLATLPADQRWQLRLKLALRDKSSKRISASSAGKHFVTDKIENTQQERYFLHSDKWHTKHTCTIGFGTVIHAGACDGRPSEEPYKNGISKAEAYRLALRDLDAFAGTVNSECKVELRQTQADALISFAYNSGGLHELAGPLNAARYEDIPALIRRTRTNNGENAKRRNKEADLFAFGTY